MEWHGGPTVMAFGSMAKPGVVSPLQVEELRGSSGPWIPGFLLGPLWIECFYWYRSWFDEVKSFLAKGCCQNPVFHPCTWTTIFLGWKPPLLDPNFEPKITIYSSFSPQLLSFWRFFFQENFLPRFWKNRPTSSAAAWHKTTAIPKRSNGSALRIPGICSKRAT